MSSSQLAIVVPYYTNQLSHDEEISLLHLFKFLGEVDIFFAIPDTLRVKDQLKDVKVKRFEAQYFKSTSSYSQLLLSKNFYKVFDPYEYILIYQLDCLAFTSDLRTWLDSGYDYIGAPWFKSIETPGKGFSRVGNGGLSLRRVESFLRVLGSGRYIEQPVPFWADMFKPVYDVDDESMPLLNLFWHRFKRYVRVLHQVRRGVQWYVANYALNEDRFWSDRASFFDPAFKIAPIEVGLRFAFERFPRYCYDKNGHQLPFGAHAWAKWDRPFWEPYLIQ